MNIKRFTYLPFHDVVCCLLEKPFLTWNEKDQYDLIKFDRPKPPMSACKRKADGKSKWRFFTSAWYLRYAWACGSVYLQNIHCWPCLLFGNEYERWVWDARLEKKNSNLFDEHVRKKEHKLCANKLTRFRNKMYRKQKNMATTIAESNEKQVRPSSVDWNFNDVFRLRSRYSFKDDVLNKLSTKCDANKLCPTVKSLEKKSEAIKTEPELDLGLEPKIAKTTATPSIMDFKANTTLNAPHIDPPDLSTPGPSSRMEPNSSMTEQEVHSALTCELYPADDPQPIILTKIKDEPIDIDEFKQDILSAAIAKEASVTNSQVGSLFQQPALIKEEPVYSEEEL